MHPPVASFPALSRWLVMALALWIPTRALMARRAPLAFIAFAVALGQAFVHLFLTATAGHHHASHTHQAVSVEPITASAAAPGTLADALGAGSMPASALGTDPVAVAVHRLAEEMTAGHALMGLAHAVAGLLVGLWLARGESAARTLAALVAAPWSASRQVADALTAVAVVIDRPQLPSVWLNQPPLLLHQHHQATLVLRGPPMTHALVSSSFALAA